MKSKKLYLAGPMTGYTHFNFVKFDTEAYKLRKQGWEVFSPAEQDRKLLDKSADWLPRLDDTDIEETERRHGDTGVRNPWQRWNPEYKLDLRTMMGYDLDWICKHAVCMAMLPGWERSRGAVTEHALAVCLGLEIRYVG